MVKRTKKIDLIDTLTKTKACLSLLPGEAERHKVALMIPEIIKELDVLRENISRFPDASEIRHVDGAIHTLISFFETLKDRPLLAEILLPKKAKSGKTKSVPVDINTLQIQLEGLPTEKILEELTKHKKDVLVALSAKLNITANKKLTKDALSDRIFKLGFANKRGYDLLIGKQAE
ncbi:MAG: hypothetical protein CV087_17825 [Candidatus Brocadia sp. WS118]|nr:MAG: hypothetical protein CV087_17825 [Candidatus Brocadia sp. WS118]